MSLNQDVSNCFDDFVPVVSIIESEISTGSVSTSHTKPNYRVARVAIVFVVTNKTDSRFCTAFMATHSVEPFLVIVVLQGGL